MSQKLEHAWVKEIFTPEELNQYASFENEMRCSSSSEQIKKDLKALAEELKKSLHIDPESAFGIAFGEKYMTCINAIYGKKYAHLRTKIFEKGFGEGKGLVEMDSTPEVVSWLEKSINAYWRNRLYGILNKVGTGISDAALLILWKDVLDDMYGEEESRKQEIYDIALTDEKVSEMAKKWLKTIREI
jgi:hypothetical protein